MTTPMEIFIEFSPVANTDGYYGHQNVTNWYFLDNLICTCKGVTWLNPAMLGVQLLLQFWMYTHATKY